MNWCQQLQQRGSSSFFEPRRVRGATVMTQQKIVECERLLLNNGIAEAARRACVKESALRKAISSGRIIHQKGRVASCEDKAGTTKSERCRLDAQAAEGLGTACTRADERVEAAMGIVQSALTRFESCRDVSFGGVLAGLPALCSNGLFSGLDKHLS